MHHRGLDAHRAGPFVMPRQQNGDVMVLNGRLPANLRAALPWPEAAHLTLRPDAAAALGRLAATFEAHFGYPLRITDAYRTLASQVSLKISKGKFAATPGTSNHGLGIAIDAAAGINIDGSPQHRWMETNGPRFGWINPAWAVDWNPRNGQHEPWHWEYHPELERRTAPAAVAKPEPVEPPEDNVWKNLVLARLKTSADVYVGDGLIARHVADPTELKDMQYRIANAGGDSAVQVVDRIAWLGKVL